MDDDDESPALAAAVARRWLENPCDSLARSRDHAAGNAFNAVVTPGFRVSVAEPGRLVCSFRVHAAVTDADGRWHAGAMAAAVDNMCSAVVYSAGGVHVFTVNQAMSFFSAAPHGEEVEMDGRVEQRKGKLTAAVVAVHHGAEEGVRRAGGRREAVDDLYESKAGEEEWREQEQALK